MTQVTIGGNAYSDDGTAARDMRAGGHRTWLLPMLADTMTRVSAAETAATSAAGSATAAASSAANLVGTSSSSVSIGTGSKSFSASTGRQWGVGQWLIAVDAANTANTMIGQVTAYTSGTGALTISVPTGGASGSGTIAGWNIYVSGSQGPQGATGATGASGNSMPRMALTAGATIGVGDNAKLIDCSGTFTVTFSGPGALGASWQTLVRNSGSGDVTLAHTSGNIDGLTSYVLYPGAARLVQCDGSTLRTIALDGGQRTYTASGTYVVPPGVAALYVLCTAAGASGGRGAREAAGVAANGGPGGGGGETLERTISGIAAGTSVTVTVPAGPTGAAGATADNTAAALGTAGGDASFGNYLVAIGGKTDAVNAGSVLTTGTVQANPGGIGANMIADVCAGRLFVDRSGTLGSCNDGAGGHGGNGRTDTGRRAGTRSLRGGGGGGAGGSISSADVATAGGAGGASGASAGVLTTFSGLGGAAGAIGAAGAAGTRRDDTPAGDGGGGGGASTSAAAGAGAAGTVPGGGGGGGGASRNGFASGAGGNGARGEVLVVEIL